MKNNLLSYVSESADEAADSVVILEGDVQDAVSEAQSAELVVDQVSDDLRSANNAIDSLYRLASTIENSTSSNTDTNAVTAVAEVALEQIYNSIGVPKPRSLSMEAGFLEDVKSGVSKIKDHAVRILAAILEAFQKAVEWVSDYLNKVTSAAGRVSSYASKLRARVRKTKGDTRTNVIKDKSLAKSLVCVGDLLTCYKNVTELVDDARAAAMGQHVQLLNEIIDGYVKSEDKDINAVLKVAARIPDVLDKAYGKIFPNGDELAKLSNAHIKEDVDVYTTDFLPGGYLGIMSVPKGLESLRHLEFSISRDSESAEADAGDGTLKTLTLKEMDDLLGQVIITCDKIAIFHRNEAKLREISGKLSKALDQMKKTPQDMKQSHREVLGVVAIMAPHIAKGIHSRVFGFATTCSKAIVSYCEKSLALYQQPEAA